MAGYDASKPDNNVESWYDADTENPANIYSMYNKTTRVKLVCIDNHVALFLAEVNTETGEIIGEYVKVISFDAVDSEGYVGIATDSPAYFEMDNLAITPISRRGRAGICRLRRRSYGKHRRGREARGHG